MHKTVGKGREKCHLLYPGVVHVLHWSRKNNIFLAAKMTFILSEQRMYKKYSPSLYSMIFGDIRWIGKILHKDGTQRIEKWWFWYTMAYWINEAKWKKSPKMDTKPWQFPKAFIKSWSKLEIWNPKCPYIVKIGLLSNTIKIFWISRQFFPRV